MGQPARFSQDRTPARDLLSLGAMPCLPTRAARRESADQLPRRDAAGFSLVEAVVATAILASAVVALAQLQAVGLRRNADARAGTMATVLADQKLEQLRSLAWYEAAGPVTDRRTDTVADGPGGTGLSPSPTDALLRDTPGYVEYLDADGRPLGQGPGVPRGTYVRRWAVEPLPSAPDDALVLRVYVVLRSSAAEPSPRARRPDAALLSTVRVRRGP